MILCFVWQQRMVCSSIEMVGGVGNIDDIQQEFEQAKAVALEIDGITRNVFCATNVFVALISYTFHKSFL